MISKNDTKFLKKLIDRFSFYKNVKTYDYPIQRGFAIKKGVRVLIIESSLTL